MDAGEGDEVGVRREQAGKGRRVAIAPGLHELA
jgi:hypothetical protein